MFEIYLISAKNEKARFHLGVGLSFAEKSEFPNPDKPRGIQIQRGKPEISKKQTTNYKFAPECSPIKEFGDKFGRG